jgi:hypothetical protein
MPCSEHRCPACRRNLVADPREPCAECAAALGGMIRPSGRQVSAEEFAAEVAEGDEAVRRVLAERRGWQGQLIDATGAVA